MITRRTLSALLTVLVLMMLAGRGVGVVDATVNSWWAEFQLGPEHGDQGSYILTVINESAADKDVVFFLALPDGWTVGAPPSGWYTAPKRAVSLPAPLAADGMGNGLLWTGTYPAGDRNHWVFDQVERPSDGHPEVRIYEEGVLVAIVRLGGMEAPDPEEPEGPELVPQVYFPLMMAGAPVPVPEDGHRITLPVEEAVIVSSYGLTHAGAYDPSGGGVWSATMSRIADIIYAPDGASVGSASITPRDAADEHYYLDRTFYEMALPSFAGRVVSAHLEYRLVAEAVGFYEPLPAPTVAFHAGTWETADFEGVNGRALWAAWGEVVAAVDTTDWYVTEVEDPDRPFDGREGRWVEMPLPPELITSGGTLRLAMRDSEDHLNLRSEAYETRRVGMNPRNPMNLVIVIEGGQ
jgi:hypothetical protein